MPDFEAKFPCADVFHGSGAFLGNQLIVGVFLEEPPCNGISYNLIVYSDSTMTTELASTSTYTVGGDDGNVVGFEPLPLNDTDVCVVVTTNFGRGPVVIDRAPDTSCVQVVASGSPAVGFH